MRKTRLPFNPDYYADRLTQAALELRLSADRDRLAKRLERHALAILSPIHVHDRIGREDPEILAAPIARI